MTILVTGATGRVGGSVVAQLGSGVAVRAVVRDPSLARLPGHVRLVAGDLTKPASVEAAAKGVDTAFLVFPSVQGDPVAPDVVDALARHVRRIVYLSAAGVDSAPVSGGIVGSHQLLERLIENSGVDWTFLRPSGFAANTLMWADQIAAGDTVRWFYGGATRALIHEFDIAAVATLALTQKGHVGARYHLTGPEQLTQVQQVAAIGAAVGKRLRFEEVSPETAKATFFAGLPDDVAQSILDGHAAMVTRPEPVTTTVAELTGTPARTFGRWAADHAADFVSRS